MQVHDGYWNMALDEMLLEEVSSRRSLPTLRFYKWKPSTISIGRNQSLTDEVDTQVAQSKGFNIVRRITGGGAVFHDETREITYSICCPLQFLEQRESFKVLEQFELITQSIILGLRKYGLEAEKGVIHCPALFLNGKKFSGNAQVRRKGHVLQHGTILLEIDAELMYSVLKAPHNVGKSRMVRSVYAKCIGVREVLQNYEEKRFLNALKEGFEDNLNIKLELEDFTEDELKKAKKIVEKRHIDENWLKKYE